MSDISTSPADDDLVSWLRGRLDLEERHALKDIAFCEAATPTPWAPWSGYNLPFSTLKHDDVTIGHLTATDGRVLADGEDDRHVADILLVARMVNGARIRATRVLAEVAAKRLILELHPHRRFVAPLYAASFHPDDRRAAFAESPRYVGCERCDFDWRYEEFTPGWWCDTVRLLALPYADRPGYREEWAP